MSAQTNDELLTPAQVAKELQLHPYTVRRYIREGKLKALHLSGYYLRIRRSEVERFLREGGTVKDTD